MNHLALSSKYELSPSARIYSKNSEYGSELWFWFSSKDMRFNRDDKLVGKMRRAWNSACRDLKFETEKPRRLMGSGHYHAASRLAALSIVQNLVCYFPSFFLTPRKTKFGPTFYVFYLFLSSDVAVFRLQESFRLVLQKISWSFHIPIWHHN